MGWAADVVGVVLLVGGCILLGPELAEIARLLTGFYQGATNAGRDGAKLEQAGHDLADAVSKIGVDVLLVLVFHVAKDPVNRPVAGGQGGAGSGGAGGPRQSRKPSPISRVSFRQSWSGLSWRVWTGPGCRRSINLPYTRSFNRFFAPKCSEPGLRIQYFSDEPRLVLLRYPRTWTKFSKPK